MATEYPVNHPLAVKKWRRELMKQALKSTSFFQYIGSTTNSLVQLKTDLQADAGDKITFGLRMQLTGDGVPGDGTLEGNEENLVTYNDAVLIDQLRHATRSKGKMSEQRVLFDLRSEGRDGLGDWFANRFDQAFFYQIAGMSTVTDLRYTGSNTPVAPDSDHIVYSYGSTAADSSCSTLFSLGYIDTLVERANVATNFMRPIDMGGGNKKWVLFLHPYQVTDMKRDTSTASWADLQKAAMSGGQITKNPLYTGALGEYNNTIIQMNTRVPSAATNTRRAVFCGAQAASLAFGGAGGGSADYFDWREEEFDYGNQLGIGGVTQWGLKKNVFNSSDFATIVLVTKAIAH